MLESSWSKGFTNRYWVEVLKEKLLLLIIQKFMIVVTKSMMDLLYNRKVAK